MFTYIVLHPLDFAQVPSIRVSQDLALFYCPTQNWAGLKKDVRPDNNVHLTASGCTSTILTVHFTQIAYFVTLHNARC
jgi:hypothetical protein